MTEQRSPRSRMLAGLLAGAVLAALAPFMGAVADHSGSAPADPARRAESTKIRRGAEARWTESIDEDRSYDYRVWVWQEAYADAEAGVWGHALVHGWHGEAVAARRICWGYELCTGFSYWRAPADLVADSSPSAVQFWMDPATGLAHLEGTLLRAGSPCQATMDWQADSPTRTSVDPPSPPSRPDAAVSRRNRASGSLSCWEPLPETTSSKVWVNTGL